MIDHAHRRSEATALRIDEEVSGLIDQAHETAEKLLTEHRAKLDEVAERLLVDETLEAEAFHAMFDDAASPQPAAEPTAEPAPEPDGGAAEPDSEAQPRPRPQAAPAPS